MPADDIEERLRVLRTIEGGSPIEWDPNPQAEGKVQITALAAFSWCVFIELEVKWRDVDLPAGVRWLGDVVSPKPGSVLDVLDVTLRASGYELSTAQPCGEEAGIVRWGGASSRTHYPPPDLWHRAKCRYWCWHIPPGGFIEVSVHWSSGGLDAVIGTFSGQAARAAAEESPRLDEDFRRLPPDRP
jgi:hypothetical protein